jgi:dihydroxyacetone kinase phosphotransfer subunit
MVGLLIVSHSLKLGEGIVELVQQLAPELPVRAAGGMNDGSLGTSVEKIHEALLALDNPSGVLVLVDLGSAVMSTEVALEWLSDVQRQRVALSGAPLVEGAVLVATNASLHLPLEELAEAAWQARDFPKTIARSTPSQERMDGVTQ